MRWGAVELCVVSKDVEVIEAADGTVGAVLRHSKRMLSLQVSNGQFGVRPFWGIVLDT